LLSEGFGSIVSDIAYLAVHQNTKRRGHLEVMADLLQDRIIRQTDGVEALLVQANLLNADYPGL